MGIDIGAGRGAQARQLLIAFAAAVLPIAGFRDCLQVAAARRASGDDSP